MPCRPEVRLLKDWRRPILSVGASLAAALRKEAAQALRAAWAAELEAGVLAWLPVAASSLSRASASWSSGDVATEGVSAGPSEGPLTRLGSMLRPGGRALPVRCMPGSGAGMSAAAAASAAAASCRGCDAALCSVAERAAPFQRSPGASRGGAPPGPFLAGASAFCRSATAPGSGQSASTQAAGDQAAQLGIHCNRQGDARDGCAALIPVIQIG